MPNKSSMSTTALNTHCGHFSLVSPPPSVSLHNARACLSLFASYINAHRLYLMPHDSNICTLTAVWRTSSVSQKCTTMTDCKFHTTGLYLCTMIHTVADYFLEMFCLFPKRHWEALFPSSYFAPRKFFPLQAALCNEGIEREKRHSHFYLTHNKQSIKMVLN